MLIRLAEPKDLERLLMLYTQLHDNSMPHIESDIIALWERMLRDEGHFVILGFHDGKLVCSCVLVVVPNLTHGQRPYALIENVVTHQLHRKKGYGTAVLSHAKDIAIKQGCYKIMLMTGAKDEETLCFYRRAGYNSDDKTAFIQWLN